MATREQYMEALKRADAAGDVENAKILARAIAAFPKEEKPKSSSLLEDFRTSVEENIGGPLGALADVNAGFLRGAADIGETILRGAPALTPPLVQAGLSFNQVGPRPSNAEKMDEAMRALGADTESLSYGAGRLGSNIAGTAGVPNILAAGARAIPGLSGLAPYLASAGFKVKDADRLGRLANVAAKAGAGAAVGGTTAGAINMDDTGVGAGIGAVLPGVGALLRPGTKLAAYIYDVLSGNMPKVQAGNIAREAAGSSLPQVRASNAALPAERSILATAETANPAYTSLMHIAEGADPEATAVLAQQAKEQANRDLLARMAGGPSQTLARQGVDQTKGTLNQITTPMRETELNAVNEATRKTAQYAGEAERFGEAASNKVTDVGRLVSASDKAQELANTAAGFPGAVPGMPRIPGRYSYWSELSKKGDQWADEAADASLTFGQARRDAEMKLSSLEAHGLKPLDVSPITASIRAKAANPNYAGNVDHRRALNAIADMMDEWTKSGGVMDARALYSIRKEGVNSAIEGLMRGADRKAVRSAVASVLADIKPVIDGAIEKSGGTGWKAYLKTFEEGMQEVNRMKLNSKLLAMYNEAPAKFRKIVEGNDPKTIEKVFGPGSYDVIAEMGDQFPVLRGMADEIRTNELIKKKADVGANAAKTILSGDSLAYKIPNILHRGVTVSNDLIGQLEDKVNAKTLKILTEGARTGKGMNEVLGMLPVTERNTILNFMLNDPRYGAGVSTAANVLSAQQ